MSASTDVKNRASMDMAVSVLRALPVDTPPSEAVDLLRRNKFPLLSLDQGSLPEWLAGSSEYQDAVAADHAEWELQRGEFEQVHDAWVKSGIRWMFIKTACIAPSFPYTSDNLDIMVPAEQGEAAKVILRRLGYVELTNIEEENKFLFRKFRNGRSVCAVHLHYWVGWDLNFFEQDTLWSRARTAPDDPLVVAPSPEDATLINLAHAFFENKTFTLHDLEKARVAWRESEPDWDYMPQMPERCGWHDGFLLSALLAADLEESALGASGVPDAVRQRWARELQRYPITARYYRRAQRQTKTFPFTVNFVFSKLLYYRKIQRDTRDSLLKKASNTVRTMGWGFKQKSGIRPKPGMVVSISGLDGSGKTTHLRGLARILEISEIKPAIYWNRVGCSPFTRLVSRGTRVFSGRRSSDSAQPDPDAPPAPVSRNPVVQTAWAWLMTLDMVVRYTVRVRLPLLLGAVGLGRVVLCDRYVLDATAEISLRTNARNPGVRSALWALRVLSPKPHLSYLVDVPEETAQERHNLPISREELRAYRERYLELAPRLNAQILDGTQAVYEVNDPVQVDVLNTFNRRYPTLLNGLLLSNPGQLNPGLRKTRG
ncbi:MAG: nucleotidyltransferase family protein [Chloroflexota bacterium]